MVQVPEPSAYAAIAGEANWSETFRFTNRLLRGGARVLVTTESSATLPQGAFVVPLDRAFDPWLDGRLTADVVRNAADFARIDLVPLDGDERLITAPMSLVRIGLFGGGGAPFNHAAILSACGFEVTFLSDADVRAGRLREVDVFLMPGGGARAMWGQIEPLGEAGCLAIAEFVRVGGMYIGCCAGSYDCIVNSDEFLAACPSQRCLQLINAGPWPGENAVGFLGLQSPGVGVVTAHNARPDHPVMYGMPADFPIVHYNGPVLDPLPESRIEGASAAVGLAAFSGWTDQFTPAEQFAGQPEGDTPTYLAQAIAAGRFSIAAGELGLGRVVAFGSHPEFGFDLPMAEWTQPARMFANAVLWQATSRTGTGMTQVATHGARIGLPAGNALAEMPPAADAVIAQVRRLQQRSIDPRPSWLAGVYSMSFYGLDPATIWRQSLNDIVNLAAETARIASELQQRIASNGAPVSGQTLQTLAQIDRWVLDERAAEWKQDGGYQGVRALLRKAERMCASALDQWNVELGPPAGPYDYLDENPYHLVVGSYLAAVGCVGGALQLMRGLAAAWAMTEDVTSPRSLAVQHR